MSLGAAAFDSDHRTKEGPSTSPRKSRRFRIIGRGLLALCVISILLVALLAYQRGPRTHSLLDWATRVPGYTITTGGYTGSWLWTSSSQIEFPDTRNTVIRLDIVSGVQTRIPAGAYLSSIARLQDTMLHLVISNNVAGNSFPAVVNRRFPDGVPQDAEVTGVGVSPDGKRRAWWVAWGKQTPAWMERLMAWIRPQPANTLVPPQTTEAILTSDRDGSHMRELGRVKAEYAPEGLGAVSWTPDSKRLVILYKRGLYTLPAD